jgi:hypothetical protein
LWQRVQYTQSLDAFVKGLRGWNVKFAPKSGGCETRE